MRSIGSHRTSLALCIIALLACKQAKDDSPAGERPDDERGSVTKPEPHGAQISGVTTGTLKPGPAYLAVTNAGIVKLDGGKTVMVQPLRFSIQDLVYGGDGAVWVSAVSGVYRIQGSESKQINTSGGFQGLAVVSSKDAYAVNYKGLHHYDGSSWTIEDKAKIGVTLLRDVEVDRDGNVWVTSSNALLSKKKGSDAWTEADVSAEIKGKPFFKELAKGPDGTLYASVSGGLLKLENGKWKKVAGDFGFGGTDHVSVGPTGTVVALSGTKRLHVLGPGGQTQIDPASANLKASSFKQVAIDGSGRIWIATDYGLVVVDEKGKTIAQWPPSTLPGVTGEISHIVVTGAGPTNLPKPTAPVTGTVKGKVLKSGSPAAGADLELCASPSMVFKSTPCEGRAFKKTTRTSATGEFSIPDVPIASYGFAVKTPGAKWMITLGSDCCSKMKQGMEYDVGAIKLK